MKNKDLFGVNSDHLKMIEKSKRKEKEPDPLSLVPMSLAYQETKKREENIPTDRLAGLRNRVKDLTFEADKEMLQMMHPGFQGVHLNTSNYREDSDEERFTDTSDEEEEPDQLSRFNYRKKSLAERKAEFRKNAKLEIHSTKC